MILNKPFTNIQYAEFAIYCNENNLTFEDKGDYLESVKISQSLDELQAEKIAELKNNKENYKIDNGYSNDYIVQNMLFGLGTYSEEERNSCRLFMNGLINKYDLKKEAIKNATLETIASKSTTFEE